MISREDEGRMMRQFARVVFYVVGTALGVVLFYFLLRVLWQIMAKASEERRREVLGFLLLILGLLVAVSLLSRSPSDYANLATGAETGNFGGIFGVLAAHWLFRVFGYFAYLVPAALLVWSVNRMRGMDLGFFARKTVLVLALAVLLALLISIRPAAAGVQGPGAGGLLGLSLGRLFVRLLGRVGSYIVGIGLVAAVLSSEQVLRRACVQASSRLRRPKLKIAFAPREKPKRLPRKKKPEPILEEGPEEKAEPVEKEPDKKKPAVSAKVLVGETMDEEYRGEFLSILADPPPHVPSETKDDLRRNSDMLEKKLLDYGIGGRVVNVSAGPVITRYEFEPAAGVKVSRVAGLADDLALAMKAERIRIVAPIPGKAAIGIEVPNKKRENVYLKDVLMSSVCAAQKSPLSIALGKDIAGEPNVAEVSAMPHLLIAGATGSGKSVAINSMVASMLYRASPSEVRFLMIDPKRLELPVYNGVPHQINPVVTEPKASLDRLKEVINWMDMRYREFATAGVRDIEGYNAKMKKKKPYIVIIVDELADLMITAPTEIEETLTRLAQMSRAVGIHLILATQRPSVDVITGLIKANFPARIAFQVASKTDSRTILDMNGAEKLLGRGDMLFLPPGKGEPVRIHGAYISTQEAKRIAELWSRIHLSTLLGSILPEESVNRVVEVVMEEDVIDCIVDRRTPGRREALDSLAQRMEVEDLMPSEEAFELFTGLDYYPKLDEQLETDEQGAEGLGGGDGEVDDLFDEAKNLVIRHKIASVSLLQRRLKIGYARAGRLIDQLEREGVVGPYSGSKAREVLVGEERDVLA
jgi:S-DNA-T family DNA segregation ATPase FtsK/SpoIIIE